MLTPEDRDAIEGLFDRIETVAAKSGPRDPDAEGLIRQRLQQANAAPYYMAQTILVQEHALKVAEQKIAELEAQTTRRPAGGGFLGGLFGDNEPQRNRQPAQSARGPWGEREDSRDGRQRGGIGGGGGGGFLAGAAQTALGVTGGVLLGSAIAGMLGGQANAAEYQPDQAADEPAADEQPNDNFDDGGDGFDVGGDF